MRILHIATRHRRFGAERRLLHTIEYERRAGHDVELAVGPESDVSQVPADIPLHVVPSLVRSVRPYHDLAALRELRKLVDRGFDIVHTHQSKAGVVGRLAARDRTKAIVHTVHMASFGPGYSRKDSAAFLAAERYCARF